MVAESCYSTNREKKHHKELRWQRAVQYQKEVKNHHKELRRQRAYSTKRKKKHTELRWQ
jgi:hypothetical protein